MQLDFAAKKRTILQHLAVPDAEYADSSPKGTVDMGIRELVDEINSVDGLVTTSSCAGRVAVFLEGRKQLAPNPQDEDEFEARVPPQVHSNAGGKGLGGRWLYVSHDAIEISEEPPAMQLRTLFGLVSPEQQTEHDPQKDSPRFVHLKFEPMILHLLTASSDHAQIVLSAALQAGFRESGAINLQRRLGAPATLMVAVRSSGLAFDAIVGYQGKEGAIVAMVDEMYLRTIVGIANERFLVNSDRINRFRLALLGAPLQSSIPALSGGKKLPSPEWEDATARKQRKRTEGLRRQLAKRDTITTASQPGAHPEPESLDIGGMFY
ncbi:methyltransferase TYW3-domain-containing protein [Cryomyces antarcticus]